MQKKSLLCAVLLLCCFVSIFSSVTAFADQTESGELHIVTTKTDDGFVQVDMYAKNARFAGLQTVFRYNPKVWTPVDASGNATTEFDAFAELKAPGKELRPLQAVRKRQLEALGFRVYVIDSTEQIGGVLNELSSP